MKVLYRLYWHVLALNSLIWYLRTVHTIPLAIKGSAVSSFGTGSLKAGWAEWHTTVMKLPYIVLTLVFHLVHERMEAEGPLRHLLHSPAFVGLKLAISLVVVYMVLSTHFTELTCCDTNTVCANTIVQRLRNQKQIMQVMFHYRSNWWPSDRVIRIWWSAISHGKEWTNGQVYACTAKVLNQSSLAETGLILRPAVQ